MTDAFAIVIPARFGSTRYPGKPLARLRGAQGGERSLIARSWDAAAHIAGPDRCWVATDDSRIADAVTGFGGRVVMTDPACRNGTERCAAALAALGPVAPIIVNFQGDAPLTPDFVVTALVAALARDKEAAMATPAVQCSSSLYQHLVDDAAGGRVGGTTMVFTAAGHALYFSKRIIPHVPEDDRQPHRHVHLHLGVYAYRATALAAYAKAPPSALETIEGLEQLRFLDAGLSVRVVPFAPLAWDCIELNNPEDIPGIEAALRQRGIE